MIKLLLHDSNWCGAGLPRICKSLETANAIACVKELHELGHMTDRDYEVALCKLLMESGYSYNMIDDEKS